MILEFDLSDALVAAEIDFQKRYKGRYEHKGSDTLFPRWLRLNFGIYTNLRTLRYSSNVEAMTLPFWGYYSHRSNELLVMFKLIYG